MTTRPSILILGGGAIGLATAIELAQQGADVTVLNHHPKSAALYAAAGMLAPQAEQITNPIFLDLCIQSRDLYPSWIHQLEAIAGISGGYWPCGILSPQYSKPHAEKRSSAICDAQQWLEQSELRRIAPYLSEDVMGGWHYVKDAQVNNRQLGHLLNLVAEKMGVRIHHDVTINRLVSKGDRIERVKTDQGDWSGDHYLLATGAWSGMLEDIPVIPRKGQMLSVTPMDGMQPIPIQHVLFGEEIYIVPRQTGEIVIGATSEDVGFTPGNTVDGIHKLLTAAMRLVPHLRSYEIHEQWWGYRPTTSDELPILGESPWTNLSIATGHYRNGILLTPITAKLISQHILNGTVHETLMPYHWSRFRAHRQRSLTHPQMGCTPIRSGAQDCI